MERLGEHGKREGIIMKLKLRIIVLFIVIINLTGEDENQRKAKEVMEGLGNQGETSFIN